MFVSDSLDYQLDQMRWEYECAMWEQAHIKNKECDKEQAKTTKRLKRMIEKAINKSKEIQCVKNTKKLKWRKMSLYSH